MLFGDFVVYLGMAKKTTKLTAAQVLEQEFEAIQVHVYDSKSPDFEAANSADVNGRDTANDEHGKLCDANRAAWMNTYMEATVVTWGMSR